MKYSRRKTHEVMVGNVALGAQNPIRVQSMNCTSTNDIEASVAQAKRIVDAGGEIVRLTTQGVREAENIGHVREGLRADGYMVPLVADVHFNPKAAFAAAQVVDKVRINPGNFVDAARTFKHLEYTDEEYAAELVRIREALLPFIAICREHGTTVRLGVNHGSLSDRIMSRYGDTPAGMVESVMEFLRVFIAEDFHRIVISIKASNTVVMVETVRRLVEAMDAEDMHFPLHLGVTEAGDGEDGRIKSAVGIGALLCDGIGDTIRVSLSEDPEREIPVAMAIRDIITRMAEAPAFDTDCAVPALPAVAVRRQSEAVGEIGGGNAPVVIGADVVAITPDVLIFEAPVADYYQRARAFFASLEAKGNKKPVVLKFDCTGEQWRLEAAVHLGALLLAGYGDGLWLAGGDATQEELNACAFAILQAARLRITKTEYISCPSCGRTLFNIQQVIKEVKAATCHLSHLKIGIMGCIVNGPGEMADADYGYVGAAAGKISLYKGKQCVEMNIPQEEAISHLVELIKQNGDWREP